MKSAVFVLLCQWRKEYFLKEKVAFTEGSKMFAVVLESNKIVFHLSFMLRTIFFSYPSWDSAFFFIRIITTFIESFPWLTVFFAVWGWKLRYFCFMSATDWQLWLWLWSRLSVLRHSSCQQSPFSLTPRNLFFIKLSLDVTTSTLSNSCDKALNFSRMKSSK